MFLPGSSCLLTEQPSCDMCFFTEDHGKEAGDHRHRLRHRWRSGHHDGPGSPAHSHPGCHLCVWECSCRKCVSERPEGALSLWARGGKVTDSVFNANDPVLKKNKILDLVIWNELSCFKVIYYFPLNSGYILKLIMTAMSFMFIYSGMDFVNLTFLHLLLLKQGLVVSLQHNICQCFLMQVPQMHHICIWFRHQNYVAVLFTV